MGIKMKKKESLNGKFRLKIMTRDNHEVLEKVGEREKKKKS